MSNTKTLGWAKSSSSTAESHGFGLSDRSLGVLFGAAFREGSKGRFEKTPGADGDTHGLTPVSLSVTGQVNDANGSRSSLSCHQVDETPRPSLDTGSVLAHFGILAASFLGTPGVHRKMLATDKNCVPASKAI